MSNPIAGCFFLDSCVVFSELLNENTERMSKFKRDVNHFNITCFVSQTVVKECEEKVKNTVDFLGNVLSNTITAYLEMVGTANQRDLSTTIISNNDLHIIRKAFLEINKQVRRFDLLTDPFQAIEEWIVENFELELDKRKKAALFSLIAKMTTVILREINNLQSAFESLVVLGSSYILQSTELPDPLVAATLVYYNIHQPDADHISVISSHQKNQHSKAIFLTFDYKTILVNWLSIQQANQKLWSINCCDPIYGLSFLR